MSHAKVDEIPSTIKINPVTGLRFLKGGSKMMLVVEKILIQLARSITSSHSSDPEILRVQASKKGILGL